MTNDETAAHTYSCSKSSSQTKIAQIEIYVKNWGLLAGARSNNPIVCYILCEFGYAIRPCTVSIY
jgi:hypothetical protein